MADEDSPPPSPDKASIAFASRNRSMSVATFLAHTPLPHASEEDPLCIVGFGHPLLDISSNVDKSFLKKYSVELGSCNLAEPNQLAIFEELSQRRDVEFVPGGACMNTVRVARWLLNRDICWFVGCLGDDEFGCILERALHRAGVKSVFQRHEVKPTGTCACLIVDRERSLLANLGAALELSMEHMAEEAVKAAMDSAGIFYLEGFFMNVVSSPTSSVTIGEHCVENNKVFAFNLSAPYLCLFFKDKLSAILPYVDILVGSIIDFEAYGESQGWDEKDMRTVVERVCALPKKNALRRRIVVMTNGAESTLVAVSGKPTREYQPLKIPEESIVDTNGAGDAFVGGFLSQIAKGRTLDQAIEIGHAAAATIIQHNGCTVPDTRPDILRDA
uniref:Adenosine kinase n=1 Tax=Neobodo designis TaxID=312471 RepID=A0A7S1QCP2_NEODS|mmetsp:Transcript_3904/g.12365  ORF Transcript_3904/g.12365 Transcript_3904/m.12365 type:complete len:388 (+) Transcript_3904:59-1222(+)|eukprot:CAMPEP_0174835276 /NCGR_PEP_ID=MMETSP1114-20130205/5325_1 /TAXON_ID=312471 /ORGANISM="Neobodo designis, Strain CCAP 1951/1" /LENGTH=387 /DNA_ID=CAMNT_0016069221 /DNA_START=58 /DNA_END=1221 /DNA_ORIENTATION=-